MSESIAERSHLSYKFDLFFYIVTPIISGLLLIVYTAIEKRGEVLMLGLVGVLLWSLLEYLLHRFVLHSLYPFKKWHALHHAKPRALICLPTPLSMFFIFTLIFLPSVYLLDLWQGIGLTYGVWIGYAIYTHIHHVVHHRRNTSSWLKKFQDQHAIHHSSFNRYDLGYQNFGVTNQFWDHIFHTHAKDKQPNNLH